MPDETAMLLTRQEWIDLSTALRHFKLVTSWVEVEHPREVAKAKDPEHMEMLDRCRRLADRIIDAARD